MKTLFKAGNWKLPRTTAVFSMGTATECPSRKLGFCQAVTKTGKPMCYALRPEYRWKAVFPYRKRMEKYWKSRSAEEFTNDFLALNACKRNKFRALRLNESGDFWSQACVDKADKIASILKVHGIKVYCYTARRDLDYTKIQNLVVMGSDFHKAGMAGIFKMVFDVKDKPEGYGVCPGSCKKCRRCLIGLNTVIKNH